LNTVVPSCDYHWMYESKSQYESDNHPWHL